MLPLTIQNYYYIPFCVTVHQAHKDVVADVSSSMLTDLQGLAASSASPPFYFALKELVSPPYK